MKRHPGSITLIDSRAKIRRGNHASALSAAIATAAGLAAAGLAEGFKPASPWGCPGRHGDSRRLSRRHQPPNDDFTSAFKLAQT